MCVNSQDCIFCISDQPENKQNLLMSSQHLIDSTTLNIAHSAQALNPKENTKHALENLWSSKLTYDTESHLLNRLKTWFKASRHGGKFLHSLGSKALSLLWFLITQCAWQQIIPRQNTHTPDFLCPETREDILSHGEHLIPGSFQGQEGISGE